MFAHIKELFTRPSGYQISRSVRLRSSASAYLQRTNGTTGTDPLKFTVSGWMKRGLSTASYFPLLGSDTGSNAFDFIGFQGDNLVFRIRNSSSVDLVRIESSAVYRDFSAWYHIVAVYDSANATSTERVKLYVNGVQLTAFGTSTYPPLNQALTGDFLTDMQIGRTNTNSTTQNYGDGYITEVNFIDGQALTPSSFGEINPVTGVWQPKKYISTYGTNGFYLNFSDNSAATAAAIGKDYSGNGNNWTPNNISVTAGTTYDSMLDVPTLYADRGNYAVMNPLDKGTNITAADGNLKATVSSTGGVILSSIGVSSGKWYWEMTRNGGTDCVIGIANSSVSKTAYLGSDANGWGYIGSSGNKVNNGSSVAYGTAYATTIVIGVALDMDSGTVTFYRSNVSQGTAYSGLTGTIYAAFGTGNNTDSVFINFGQRPFAYTPPTGFLSLNTQNLPTPTISNGAAYMAANLFTGNSATQTVNNAVNNVSFQPDLIWFKNRSNALDHAILDAVRGGTPPLFLSSNLTTAEGSTGGGESITYNSNGFAVISNNQRINFSGHTYVAWQWNAGNSTVTNTSGSISAQVRANPTAGFSVVTYTGNGSNGATVGHGLGVVPAMMIIKSRNYGSVGWDWIVYHRSLNTSTEYLVLNSTAAKATAAGLWSTSSSTFGFPTAYSTTNSAGVTSPYSNFVAYCFAAVAGYSAFGSYTGNSSADGPFVYLGFRARYILIKNSTLGGAGQSMWYIYDTTRNTFNVMNLNLSTESSAAEVTSTNEILDVCSNGFKLRGSSNVTNASTHTYIYAAFAENPFKNSLAR